MSRRVAIATCRQLPDLDPDGPALLAALGAHGVSAEPAIWDDPGVDWSSYDLVVVRNTWDYVDRRAEFVNWSAGLARAANPAGILRWNTDKRYLADLEAAGVPTVATRFFAPEDDPVLPQWDDYVIKPAVSAGAADTARWRRGPDDAAALAHLHDLAAAGRTTMVQPYLSAVDIAGESALIYLGGRFSHSVRKGPLLTVGALTPAISLDDVDPTEHITPRDATPAELAVAERVLAAVPAVADGLLYARVDLLPDDRGDPVLLELELTEPSLFLWASPGAADRLADAIANLL